MQYRHSTWAHTYVCSPILFFRPANLDDLRSIIQNARRNCQTITVIGSAHSPSTLTMTTGVLVNLDRISRVLEFKPGMGFTDVVVEAGMRLRDLNELLAQKGLALQNLGSISDQSVAGVISTGTHGSSAYHGLISEQIVELKLLNQDAQLIACSDTLNPELFRAALLSLGKFGVIVEATVRTVPAFALECTQEIVEFDDFMDNWWSTFFTSAEYHRIWWYPYSRKLIVWRANRTQNPISPLKTTFYGTRVGRTLYQFLLWCSVCIKPSWTPAVERWLFRNQFGPKCVYVDRSDKAINMDCLFSQFVDEWSLPLSNGHDCVLELDKRIHNAAVTDEYYVHAPIEIRVSNTTLPAEPLATRHGAVVAGIPNVGPIYGNISRPYLDPSPKLEYAHPPEISYDNLTLNLNATMYRPFGFDSDVREWFTQFEDVCEDQGGRPHWAKNFIGKRRSNTTRHHMNGISPQIERWYGEDLSLWKQLRKKYDCDGVFVGNKRWLNINGLN